MRSLAALLVLSLASGIALATSPAWADPATRPGRPSGPIETGALLAEAQSAGAAETDAELQSTIASLRERRAAIHLGGPRAAAAAGGAAAGVGVLLMSVTGVVCSRTWSDCADTPNDDVLYGVGGAAAGLGVGALVTGVSMLRNGSQERREIDREIMDLERQLGSERARRIGVGLAAGGKPGLSLRVAS